MTETQEFKILTREQILESDDRPVETVPVPEIMAGGAVMVQGLSLGEAHDLLEEIRDEDDEGKIDTERMNLLAVTFGIVGEDRQRLFTEADYEVLLDKSAAALLRVTKVFTRLSGLEEDAQDEAEKNS